MKATELRIRNHVRQRNQTNPNDYWKIRHLSETDNLDNLEPIKLTKARLIYFGFEEIKNDSYINGFQYHLQVNGEGRDGTWFDGIGNLEDTLGVNTLCRGNYICGIVKYVHQLQNLYFALTGKELI